MDDAFAAASQEPSMDNNEGAPQPDMPQNAPMPQDGRMDASIPDAPTDAPAGREGDDSTMGIINRLSDEDKEAVRSYAQSMLEKEKEPEDKAEAPAPVQERIFTKGEIQKMKDESLLDKGKPYSSDAPLEKKMKVSKSSPFTAPVFK